MTKESSSFLTKYFARANQYFSNKSAWYLPDDVNYRNEDGTTAIISAAKEGNLEQVRIYLQRGASINLPDDIGMTALHCAAANGHLEVITELTNQPQIDIDILNNRNQTPAMLAQGKYPECLALLKKHGAILDVNEKKENEKTLLMQAAEAGNIKQVKNFLAREAKVSEQDNDGHTALHFAAANGHHLIILMLIREKAYVDVMSLASETPLLQAVRAGHVACIQALVKGGANLNSRDAEGHTPVMFAARLKNVSCLKLLVENGSNLHLVDGDSFIALTHAAKSGRLNNLEYLLAYRRSSDGSRARIIDFEKYPEHLTAVIEGVREGHIKCVKALRQAGARINSSSIDTFVSIIRSALADNIFKPDVIVAYSEVRNQYHQFLGYPVSMENVSTDLLASAIDRGDTATVLKALACGADYVGPFLRRVTKENGDYISRFVNSISEAIRKNNVSLVASMIGRYHASPDTLIKYCVTGPEGIEMRALIQSRLNSGANLEEKLSQYGRSLNNRGIESKNFVNLVSNFLTDMPSSSIQR